MMNASRIRPLRSGLVLPSTACSRPGEALIARRHTGGRGRLKERALEHVNSAAMLSLSRTISRTQASRKSGLVTSGRSLTL